MILDGAEWSKTPDSWLLTLPAIGRDSPELPSLRDIVLAATPHQRRACVERLAAGVRWLKSARDDAERARSGDDAAGDERALTWDEINARLERLGSRAEELFRRDPRTVPPIEPLSREEQYEIGRALGEARYLFWESLYKVPLAQREILKQLSSIADGKSARGVIFEQHGRSISATQDASESTTEALIRDTVERSRRLQLDPRSPEQRETIAGLLLRTPIMPEEALVLAGRVFEVSRELIECETKLLCGYETIDDALRAKDPLSARWRALSGACGGSALAAHAMLQELESRQARYLRLRDYFAMSNVGLVYSRASRSYNIGVVDSHDLIQRGFIGLLYSIERFDPVLGFRLSTFASSSVGRSVYREAMAHRFPVSVGESASSAARAVRNVASGRSHVSTQELELTLQTTTDRVLGLLRATLGSYSLDAHAYDESERSFGELVGDHAVPSARDVAFQKELQEAIQGACDSSLTEEMREIVSMSFGLSGYHEHSVKEIATHLGKATSRVIQQRNLALRLLKNNPKIQALG